MVFESSKSPHYNLRILFEVDEHVLILFDSFELPVWAVEDEVEVQLTVTCKLDLNVLACAVQLSHYYFDIQFLSILKCLYLIGCLLHPYYEIVLLVVDKFSTLI